MGRIIFDKHPPDVIGRVRRYKKGVKKKTRKKTLNIYKEEEEFWERADKGENFPRGPLPVTKNTNKLHEKRQKNKGKLNQRAHELKMRLFKELQERIKKGGMSKEEIKQEVELIQSIGGSA